MNKKDEALHSSEQALKIDDKNGKIYYKKAQAFLKYINRSTQDIKLGFFYLNKAYELSRDESILVQMHKIKKQLDEQREKQKNWFKFMFDKNKAAADSLNDNRSKVIDSKINGKGSEIGNGNRQDKNKKSEKMNINDSRMNSKEKVGQQSIKQVNKSEADDKREKKMREQMNKFREENE